VAVGGCERKGGVADGQQFADGQICLGERNPQQPSWHGSSGDGQLGNSPYRDGECSDFDRATSQDQHSSQDQHA
jgi:hypothetical protein